MDTNNVEHEKQLVVFSLYHEEFGVEITQVKEIIKPPSITRLPHVDDYIEGVTNLRGEVIPVISLRKRFGIDAEDTANEGRIIIAEIDESRIGFIVDAVTEVLRIPHSSVEPPPRSIAGLRSDYLNGVGKLDGRLLILLDVDRILKSDEQIELTPLEDEAIAVGQEE